MRKLYYASGFVILSDTVCAAVLDYAHALAEVGKSDVVEVPALSDEGARGQTTLLLGPASQLFAAPALDRAVDLEDAEVVATIRTNIARLRPPNPQIEDQDPVTEHYGEWPGTGSTE
ncbi:hypothetical protein [Planctomonas deserti]|jgi:hypothetical protein|uniref:hypothetical protein n=1 Tax=Planctomonas deserti TaxID=2144185 RepID=UPI000D398BC5|nr:hypothetical protein [Planctomonas deserti]